MNVTVRNVITSMRFMSAVDWAEFFESVSLVDAVLRANSNFAAMDFPTRDAIGTRSRNWHEAPATPRSRPRDSRSRPPNARLPTGPGRDAATVRREQDPGYYLISRGRQAVEQELGFRAPLSEWIARANAAAGIPGYLGTIAVVNAIYSRARVVRARALRSQRMDAFRAGDSRRAARDGRGGGAGQPRRPDLYRSGPAARSGASRRSAGGITHDGRRAHAADDTGGTRGASRAPGSSLSGEPGRRPSFRIALGLDRFRD